MKSKLQKKLKTLVRKRSAKLPVGVPVTLRELCGPSWWGALPKGDRIAAGQYIHGLVRRHKLPLMDLGRDQRNHQQYVRL